MVLNVGLLYRVVLPQVRETLMWFRSITDLFEVCEFCWIMNVSSFSFGIDVMHNSRNHGSDSLHVSHVFSLAEQSVMVWFWHGFLLCNLSEQTGFCFLYFFHHAIVVIWLLIQVYIYNKKKTNDMVLFVNLIYQTELPKKNCLLKATYIYPLIMINSSKKKLWYILFSQKTKDIFFNSWCQMFYYCHSLYYLVVKFCGFLMFVWCCLLFNEIYYYH